MIQLTTSFKDGHFSTNHNYPHRHLYTTIELIKLAPSRKDILKNNRNKLLLKLLYFDIYEKVFSVPSILEMYLIILKC